MANILVLFGDRKFRNSLWLVKRQARRTGFFDKIRVYGPEQLPPALTQSPYFTYRRGYGFWLWKPWIVKDALDHADEGDIVYYVDAGSRINNNPEAWHELERLMQDHDAVFYRYREDHDYNWQANFGQTLTNIKYWCKPSTLEYFRGYYKDDTYLDLPKAWAGFFAVKRTDHPNAVINDWTDLALQRADLFADPMGAERHNLPDYFVTHRHDMSVLTLLMYYYASIDPGVLILEETAESDWDGGPVAAVRYKCPEMSWWATLKFRLYHILHTV